MRFVRLSLLLATLAISALGAEPAPPAPLKVVGVLGNTAGLSDRPVPYAFYTGVAVDARGRLYLAGAAEGIVVTDQDGRCLAVLPLPQAEGRVCRSLLAKAGGFLFFTAQGGSGSALYRVDTSAADVAGLKVERLAAGAGDWAVSPTLDAAGRVVVGQGDAAHHAYAVSACEPRAGRLAPLFSLALPQGATSPWRHLVQVDPDGGISITHLGGANFSGRFNARGERLGDALPGQIIGGFRYHFGYEGGLRRTDLAGNPAPGECGSGLPELRMAAQMARAGDRYFFAGRGGAVEAEWGGTSFLYKRRIGGIFLEDLADDGGSLQGIAYTVSGNQDVQHPLEIPKEQPIGQLLKAGSPLHGKAVVAFVPAPEGKVLVCRGQGGVRVCYVGPAHLEFDLPAPQVKQAGQAAVLDKDLLLADPASGTVWRRPLLDRQAPFTAWVTGRPGVAAVAVSPDAVFVATATRVFRLSRDGRQEEWASPEEYRGIRRLAATPDFVYVCDTAGCVVDQLDAKTGARWARLGVFGEPGVTLDHLSRPYAVAADLNGVYVADNGAGRVLVATTTLWRPKIARLPREDKSPIAAARFTVKAPAAGRMSLNVYDASDVTVRQLVCAQPVARAAGAKVPVVWDGRDMYGKWAKPGLYRYHGIIAPKLSLRYVTSIGQSGNPPYRTADGRGSWGGVWGDVMDICPVTDAPDSDIVVLWAFEEGEGGLIRMSQDGAVRWKAHLDWWMKASQMAVASDGTSIYVACASAMNAPAGQSNYSGELNRPMLWRVDAATGAKRLYMNGTQEQPMFGEYLKGDRIVTDVAVHDGRLYLTAPAQNRLFVVDAATAKQLAAWPLENASGVSFDTQGHLLAGSGSKVVLLGPDGQVQRTVADLGGEIWDLDAAADGTLAATVGAPRHQVVILDGQGKEIRALGRRGGRPLCGKMIPDSFLKPVGLCIAGGRLFVAEHAAPRRFTRWSLAGQLEKEFHGPYYYSGMFGVDEENPEYVYGDTHGDIIRYRVDYATGKWSVDAYWIDAYGQAGLPIKWWPRIRHKDGKTYWCSGSGGIAELLPDRVRGVACAFGGWVEKKPDGGYEPTNKNTGLKGAYADLNGDGKKQPGEWIVTASPAYPIKGSGPQQGWGCYFDESFNLYMHDWSDDETGGVWMLPVEWRNGTPVYRWETARHVGLNRGHGLQHGASGARTAFASGGGVYAFNGGYNAAGLPGVGHGHDWEFAQVTRYDPATGRPVWHAGERCAGFAAPGGHYCPTGPAGIIGDYLFWTDENSLVQVWDTQHGLTVDRLLEDISRDPKPSPYTVWVELFNTRVFRNRQNGKVYLMAASDAIHVYEVIGADRKPLRFSGTFRLTPEGLAAAQKRWEARTAEPERTLEIPRAAGPVKVDGDLGEFAKAPAAQVALRPGAQGTFRLLYDDRYLYVACEVQDDSPWKNAGGEISTLFKTGDTVDVWVGPSRGKRPVGIGDVRVLFAPGPDGKPQVVAFRPKVAFGAKPVPFRSPAGQVTMDRVEALADVPAAVKLLPDGYRLETAIPRAEIGLAGNVSRFGLDLSLNFSDPAGQRNTARIHWGRNGAAIVYDLPSEARLEPETWGVGVFR